MVAAFRLKPSGHFRRQIHSAAAPNNPRANVEGSGRVTGNGPPMSRPPAGIRSVMLSGVPGGEEVKSHDPVAWVHGGVCIFAAATSKVAAPTQARSTKSAWARSAIPGITPTPSSKKPPSSIPLMIDSLVALIVTG